MKQSHKPLIIEKIATALMRLAMTRSEFFKGLDMGDTIRYAFSLDADLVTFTICFPLPGSQVYDYIKGRYKFKAIDWATFDIKNSIYPVSRLSSGDLRRLHKRLMFRLRIENKFKKVMKK